MIPLVIVTFVASNAPFGRRKADPRQVRVLLEDEFRKANLARAQRLSLIVVLLLQAPLAILFSGLTTIVAVTAMAEATIAIGMVSLIASFLVFDRG